MDDNERRERRTARLVELRVDAPDGDQGDGAPGAARILGHAAVFSHLSEDLGGFREIIQPGFFDNVLEDDVRGLWNHNSDLVLGRTRSGTLALRQDDEGLAVEIDPPATTWARDAMVTMQRGDVDQMSFAFWVREGGDRWEQRDDGTVVRTLLAGGCERLFDVSPVTYPAYPQTNATVRAHAQTVRALNGTEQSSSSGAGQAPDPESGEQEPDPRARLDLLRRRLDLAGSGLTNTRDVSRETTDGGGS